jgi:hypothetical protein
MYLEIPKVELKNPSDGCVAWRAKAPLKNLCDTALALAACYHRRGTRIAVQMAQKALYSRVKADMRVMGWPNGSGHATRREREFR